MKFSTRFIVGRRGEPIVVIMGIQDFINTIAPEPEVLTLIGEASERNGTNRLAIREIDAVIAAVRRAKRTQNAVRGKI